MPGTIGDARKRRDNSTAPDTTRVHVAPHNLGLATGIPAGSRVRIHRTGHPTLWATLRGYVVDAHAGTVLGVNLDHDGRTVFVPWHAVLGLERA
jgi:hypothetical protein